MRSSASSCWPSAVLGLPPPSPIDKNELRAKGCIKIREGEWVVDAALQEKARKYPETIVDQYRLKPILVDRDELKIAGVEISFLTPDSFLRRTEFQQGEKGVGGYVKDKLQKLKKRLKEGDPDQLKTKLKEEDIGVTEYRIVFANDTSKDIEKLKNDDELLKVVQDLKQNHGIDVRIDVFEPPSAGAGNITKADHLGELMDTDWGSVPMKTFEFP